MNDQQEKIIYEGKTACWRCGKIVKGKMAMRGEDKISYLIYDCPRDGVYEYIMGKGELSYLSLVYDKIPDNWPQWKPELEMSWDDVNIKNRHNIPVFVFGATSNCNSSCRICSFSELDKKDAKSFGLSAGFIKDKLSPYKGKEAILCGGEVTTLENLPEIISLIKDSGNTPVVQTNGLKMADLEYVKILKKAGLRHVHFSFDGFEEEIYEKVRGGRHEYSLKMKALNNLIRQNFRISLTTVIMKGINEEQISEIIHYAIRIRNVVEVVFLCFCLTPAGAKNGFSTGNIMSSEEINKLVVEELGVSSGNFQLWDEFKIKLAFALDKLKSKLPFIPLPVFRKGMIYLKRKNKHIVPLLGARRLSKLIDALDRDDLFYVVSNLSPLLAKVIIRNCWRRDIKEDLFYYRENIFKVSVISPLNTYCFGPTSVTSFGFYNPNFERYNKIHQR